MVQTASNLPASWAAKAAKDPARAVPGSAPNFGREALPHVYSVSGRFSVQGQAYPWADQALRDSRENAEIMRTECGIMECLEARQRGTALLKWHVEARDTKDESARDLAQKVTDILQDTWQFLELRRNLLEALWYGRYVTSHKYGIGNFNGTQRQFIKKWSPRHGDKIVFRYDDGTGTFDDDQIGLRVSGGYLNANEDYRRQVEHTSWWGPVYWLNDYQRELVALHRHMIEDGEFFDPRDAGKVNGVGVRDRIYWTWYAMQECLANALNFIERSAMGIEIWKYPAGNPVAEARTVEAAENRSNKAVLLVPVQPGELADLQDVQIIEPGMGGVDQVMSMIKDFFAHKIKRYILGQTLTSEAEATGLGSGVADAHMATYSDIITYDATKLQETMTDDIVRRIQLFNFPESADTKLLFRIDTESEDMERKLEAWRNAWDMGAKLPESDVMSIIGARMPDDGDRVLQNPQFAEGGGGMPGTPGGMSEPMQDGMQQWNQGDGGGQWKPGTTSVFGPMGAKGGDGANSIELGERKDPDRYAASCVNEAASTVHDDPSDRQREAGNYRKGHCRIYGLDISIETPKGTPRRPEWPALTAHYGYIKRTVDKDGDQVDVFIGDDIDSEIVFVVDQETPGGRFDEHKVLVGFSNRRDAIRAYKDSYAPGWRVGPVTPMTIDQFKDWLESGDQMERAAKQVSKFAASNWDESNCDPMLDILNGQIRAYESCGVQPPISLVAERNCYARKAAKGQASLVWDEDEHDRDESGKFTSGGSSSNKPAATSADSGEFELKNDAPKKKIAGKGKEKQNALFGKEGLPDQMNMFNDKAVPDSLLPRDQREKKFKTAGEAIKAGLPHAGWTGPISEAFVNEEIDEDHPAWQSISANKPRIRDYTDAAYVFGQHVQSLALRGVVGKVTDLSDDAMMATVTHADGSTSQHTPESLDRIGPGLQKRLQQGNASPHRIEYMANALAAESIDNDENISVTMRRHGIEPTLKTKLLRIAISDARERITEERKPKPSDARQRAMDRQTARQNQYTRDGEPIHYAKKSTPGQQSIFGEGGHGENKSKPQGKLKWITIGGKDGEGKGTHVQVDDDGNIAKGPAALEGRNLDAIDKGVAGTANDKRKENKPPGKQQADTKTDHLDDTAEEKRKKELVDKIAELDPKMPIGLLGKLNEKALQATLEQLEERKGNDDAKPDNRSKDSDGRDPRSKERERRERDNPREADDSGNKAGPADNGDRGRRESGNDLPPETPTKTDAEVSAKAVDEEPNATTGSTGEKSKPEAKKSNGDVSTNGDGKAKRERQKQKTLLAAKEAVASGDASPRDAATVDNDATNAGNYAWARPSSVANAGEDLKGSARHKANAWQSIADAERDGKGEMFATRKFLDKQFPHDLIGLADDDPKRAVSAMTAFLAMKKFPAKPGYGKQKSKDPEKDRRQYVETYHHLKAKARELAASGADPIALLDGIKHEISKKIGELRQGDMYNATANSLIAMQKATRTRYGSSTVAKQVNDFLAMHDERYGEATEDRWDTLKSHAADVMEGKSFNKTFGKGSTANGKAKRTFSTADAYVAHAKREGGRENGSNAAEAVDHLAGQMGVRGVQFGNSMTDEEREHHSKKATESFMDLMDVLGLADEDVSLGGKLGVAFGARGHGTASAHYEPVDKNINLTRKSGVGTLAHEWGHFFDNEIAGGGAEEYGSEDFRYRVMQRKAVDERKAKDPNYEPSASFDANWPPFKDDNERDLAYAMNDAVLSMESSGFRNRAIAALNYYVSEKRLSAKRANDYWLSGREMFARTFEVYVQHKLKSSGRENTYLAGLKDYGSEERRRIMGTAAWPTPDEIEKMTPAFDAIFAAFKKKQSTGNTNG